MAGFIRKIFIGPSDHEHKSREAYSDQARYVKEIWEDHTYHSYGVERIFRLFLGLIQFIYPTMLLRSLLSRYGPVTKKMGIEFYYFLKMLFPVIILSLIHI